MIGEAFWENPEEEKTLVQESKQEELVQEQSQPSLNELEHHSNEESSSSEEPSHPALRAVSGVVTLVVFSLILWNSLGHAFLLETESTDYANEAMSWPITSVHIDSEIEVWTEEVSCGDESTCYEDFFRANLILNCALLNDGNYTCGPEVENGTLIQTNLACKPNHSIFASGGNQHSISGPMPNPCSSAMSYGNMKATIFLGNTSTSDTKILGKSTIQNADGKVNQTMSRIGIAISITVNTIRGGTS